MTPAEMLKREIVCKQCAKPLQGRRSDAIYCSPYCAQRAFYARKPARTLKCGTCERPFTPKSSGALYCTPACSLTADKARIHAKNSGAGKGWSAGTEKVPRKDCEMCGAKFYAPPCQTARGGGRFCSNNCRTKDIALHPERYPQTATRRGAGGRREDLGGLYVRSAWEANYARYLNWLVAQGAIARWEFEPDTFEFKDIKRGSRFYTPDFKVFDAAGGYEYHEVKGYMDQKSRTKLARMSKYFPGERLILIDAAVYRGIARTVAGLLPHWEHRR